MKRSTTGRGDAIPRVLDLLSSPFARRKFDRKLETCEPARRVLSFCRYRRAPEHLYYARPSSRPEVLGLRRERSSLIVIDLAFPMKWYEDVYRRRLACASGHFVFGVAEELGRGEPVVPCGRQARGCSLRLAHAVARQERGAWRLDWRGAPAGYGAPPAPPPLAAGDYYGAALLDRIRRDVDDVLSHRRAGS